MFAPIDRTETIQRSRSTLVFDRADQAAQDHRGWITQQKVYEGFFAVDFSDFALVMSGHLPHNRVEKVAFQ